MKNRAQHANSPAFFVDCADYFFNIHEPDLAIQVLSNLAEMAPDDAATLRILGHRLAIAGAFDLAVLTLEQVLRLRPDDPQSYRDLALVLAQRADAGRKARQTSDVRAADRRDWFVSIGPRAASQHPRRLCAGRSIC